MGMGYGYGGDQKKDRAERLEEKRRNKSGDPPTPAKRGRPKGSKNKPKA